MATVDVLFPTYNRSAMLRQYLESIQAQTYSDIRVIIGDNCSDDAAGMVAWGVLAVSAHPSGSLTPGNEPASSEFQCRSRLDTLSIPLPRRHVDEFLPAFCLMLLRDRETAGEAKKLSCLG